MTKHKQKFENLKGLLVLAAIVALVTLPRVRELGAFVAFDEPLYWPWSNEFFQALHAGDWAGTIIGRGHPGITVLLIQCLGLAARYGWAVLTGLPPAQALAQLHLDQETIVFSDLAARRLPMALSNVLLLLGLLWLVYRQFGRNVALVATVLLALDPFLLSDSRTIRGDALMATLMTSSAICLLIYLTEHRWRYLFLSGAAMGLAGANKTSAVAILPFIGLMLLVFAIWRARQDHWAAGLRFGLVAGLIWSGTAGVVFWAVWPALWVTPGPALAWMFHFAFDTGLDGGRINYFMGQISTDRSLPFFYLVTIPLRLSPLIMIGLIVGAFEFIFMGQGRPFVEKLKTQFTPQTPPFSRPNPTLTALGLVLYGISIWLVITIGYLKRDHYAMPLFPALDILGAIGLVKLAGVLANKWTTTKQPGSMPQGVVAPPHHHSRLFVSATLALVLIVQAVVALPHHPYYYSYFNPLVFGSRWAYQATMLAWGLDLGVAAAYLNNLDNAESLKIASTTVRSLAPEIKGETIRLVYGEPWIQADYLLLPAEDLQLKKVEPFYYDYLVRQPLIKEVRFGGLPLAWIYQGPEADYFVDSKLDGLGLLLGYDVAQQTLPAGDTVALRLFWQNDGAGKDDRLFARLVSLGGYVWSETLTRPRPGYEAASLTRQAIIESEADLSVPVGTPPGDYFLQIGFQSAGMGEQLGQFQLPSGGDKLAVTRPTKSVQVFYSLENQSLNRLVAPDLTLMGYNLPGNVLVRSEPNWLTLFWQAEAVLSKDYVVDLQLLDSADREAAYWLGRPVLSSYPTTQWAAGEIVADPWRLELPANLSPGDYILQVTLFDAATQAQAGQTKLGAITVIKRPQHFDMPALPHSINKQLGAQITLLGYHLMTQPIMGGGRLRLTLYWQAKGAVATSYTVFVHLLDAQGRVVAQHDGLPADGTIPTTDWAASEIISDRHLVEFSKLTPGDYRLIAGMYDPATGERLSVAGGDNAVFLETISIH